MEASIWPCQTSDKSSEVWGMVWTWRSYERKTVEYLTKERPDFRRQVLRSAWGQTESKIRFGSGPGRPKLSPVSDGSAAFFDSIFDLEPGHRPKPSNRTEIRFAKPAKTALQNHKLWHDRVFSVESDGEGPRSKFEREDGQTEGGKLARASICDVMVPHWCHLAIMAWSRDWIKYLIVTIICGYYILRIFAIWKKSQN